MLVGAKACEMLKDGQPIIAKYGYPLNFDMALVGAVFMVAGFYFKNAIDWLNAQKQWLLLAIVAALFVVDRYNPIEQKTTAYEMHKSIVAPHWASLYDQKSPTKCPTIYTHLHNLIALPFPYLSF